MQIPNSGGERFLGNQIGDGIYRTLDLRLGSEGGLEPGESAKAYVSRVVVPSMDLGEVTERMTIDGTITNVDSDATWNMHLVPQDERWWVYAWWMQKPLGYGLWPIVTASARDGLTSLPAMPDGISTAVPPILAASDRDFLRYFNPAIPLGPEWALQVISVGLTVGGNMSSGAYVLKRKWTYVDGD